MSAHAPDLTDGLTPDLPDGETLFGDFVRRLRPYEPVHVAPSGQLTRLAGAGALGSLGAVPFLHWLPNPQTADKPFYHPARGYLHGLLSAGHALTTPLAIFALLSLASIAVIWFKRIPSPVATYFVIAQPWIGVVVAAAAGLAWMLFLAGFLACLIVAVVLFALLVVKVAAITLLVLLGLWVVGLVARA